MNRASNSILALVVMMALVAGPSSRPASSNLAPGANLIRQTPDRGTDANVLTKPGQDKCKLPAESFASELKDAIRVSYSRGLNTGDGCPEDFRLSPVQQQLTHIFFAVVPDPVHTNLALFFDRQMDALQQGVQESGWAFERALLPWDNHRYPESSDFKTRVQQQLFEADQQQEPGLLIFSHAPTTSANQPLRLLVFVVGETPTAGIEKKQFREAFKVAQEIGAADTASPLIIFGPTFSGSLKSLSDLLDCPGKCQTPARIYSGTISSKRSMDDFKKSVTSACLTSLEENDEYAIEQFALFQKHRRYNRSDIAVLSEDETAYGTNANETPEEKFHPANHKTTSGSEVSGNPEGSDPPARVTYLYFPREISQLRSAYQQSTSREQAAENQAPRTTLPLNLESADSDLDTVAQFSKQISLSQEAVLLGIVGELRKHHSKFVLLRATDPLDQLFLARYLRTAYPDARIVIVASDLLFARELADSRLHGVMALTTYSLTPGADDDLRDTDSPHADRVFPSANSVGSYNAAKLLMAQSIDPQVEIPRPDLSGCSLAIPVHLFQYNSFDNKQLSPLLRVTVLGHDGYWEVTTLPFQSGLNLVGTTKEAIFGQKRESNTSNVDPSVAMKTGSTLPQVTAAPKRQEQKQSRSWWDKFWSTREHRSWWEKFWSTREHKPPPPAWNFFWFASIALGLAYVIAIWSASCFSSSHAIAQLAPRRRGSRAFLFMAIAYMHFVFLVAALWPYQYFPEYGTRVVLFALIAVLLLVMYTGLKDVDFRGGPLYNKLLFAGYCVTGVIVMLIWNGNNEHNRSVYRSIHIASGISDLLPIMLFLAAGLWCAWHALSSTVLQDGRGIRLPSRADVDKKVQHTEADVVLTNKAYDNESSRYGSILSDDQRRLKALLDPDRWDVPSLLVSLILVLLVLWYSDFRPLQSLEPRSHDFLIAALASCSALVLIYCTLHLGRTWLEFRRFLVALDSTPLRRGFQRLEGFSWSPLWRLGSGTFGEFRRLISRQGEALRCVLNLLPGLIEKSRSEGQFGQAENKARAKYHEALAAYTGRWDWNGAIASARNALEARAEKGKTEVTGTVQSGAMGTAPVQVRETQGKEPESRPGRVRILWNAFLILMRKLNEQKDKEAQLFEAFQQMQSNFASTAGDCLRYAAAHWQREVCMIQTNKERDAKAKDSDLQKGSAAPAIPEPVAACEQYLAILYTNFILLASARLRGLIMVIGGVYVLSMLALSIYPFQPQVEIRLGLILVLIFIIAIVGTVYAQMHRDATLSHLTNTTPGELGADFWLRTASFVALPIFGLVASQYPELGNVVYSWIQPALHAFK